MQEEETKASVIKRLEYAANEKRSNKNTTKNTPRKENNTTKYSSPFFGFHAFYDHYSSQKSPTNTSSTTNLRKFTA